MSGTGSQRDASGARGFAADSERAERTDRTERTERTGPRLLVRAPSWLGDFCMAEPTLAAVATSGTVPVGDGSSLSSAMAPPHAAATRQLTAKRTSTDLSR